MIRSIFLFFSIISISYADDTHKIIRVTDGDTVTITAPYLPPPLKPVLSLRVIGVDTPEKNHRAQCPAEHIKAMKATTFTKNIISEANHTTVNIKSWDKYGGRVLGDIIIDDTPLSMLLIKQGLARPYDGGKKSSWCN